MEYTTLEDVKIETIVECLSKSFANYYVEMPSDTEFWKERFKNGRVDHAFSWGAFNDNKLVGFVINGIDTDKGILTAYNSGTGVLPEFRGHQIVDRLYQFGLDALKKRGVKRCTLEVIDKNKKAIRVYERIGFHTNHKLFCFKGQLQKSNKERIHEVKIEDIVQYEAYHHYSWDNTYETISKAGKSYMVYNVFTKNENEPVGYFIINPSNGYIAQLESKNNNWKSIFDGISQIHQEVRINNVKENRTHLRSYISDLNFDNTINQIEMEMKI
jgi:GNAT superfamily N-acetyltransferase